jgi:hypothetical protein
MSTTQTGPSVVYIGPLGQLIAIQVPPEGYDNPVTELGALHTGLSGAQTKDVFGYKRTFTMPLDGLEPRAWAWFEMLFRQAVTPPYYWLDPRRRNRLRASVSTTLSTYTTATVFTPSSGTAVASASSAPLLPSGSYSTPAPDFAVTWTPTAAGTLLGETAPVPVIPGEQLCFSCYVLAGSPTLELVPYNSALVAQPVQAGTSDVPGTIDRKYVIYDVPANGSIVGVRPQLRAAAAGTFTTLAWQLSDTALPEPWVMGDGVPKFLVDQMPSHAEYLNRYTSGSIVCPEV